MADKVWGHLQVIWCQTRDQIKITAILRHLVSIKHNQFEDLRQFDMKNPQIEAINWWSFKQVDFPSIDLYFDFQTDRLPNKNT